MADAAYEAQAPAAAGFDASDRLDGIDVPALVLHGTADRVVPVENASLLESGLSEAELVTLDTAPLLLFIEHADEVTERIRGFLAYL